MANIMPPSALPSLALICPSFSQAFAHQPLRLPALERLAAYGAAPLRTVPTRQLDAWHSELLQAVDIGDQSLYPSAPLTWIGAGNDPEPGTWLHADPVVQSISAHGLAMQLCSAWTATQLAEVAPLVRDHLATEHMHWRAVDGHSFLHIDSVIDVQTVTARQATLSELQEALPAGPGATTVRRAMNELQMLLHEKLTYPAAPNAIWLWGAGVMPQLLPRALPPMWTNDHYTRGIYRAHGVSDRCSVLRSFDVIADSASAQPTLAVVHGSPEALEQQWFVPALRALDQKQLHSVSVYLDGWQLQARRSLVRRLFARSRPIAEWMN